MDSMPEYNDEKMTINEVVNEFADWLECNWPASFMSPSQYRKALNELDELGMLEFDEILESYDNLHLDIKEFDFPANDEEFEQKISEAINDHIAYLEEQRDDYDDYSNEEYW